MLFSTAICLNQSLFLHREKKSEMIAGNWNENYVIQSETEDNFRILPILPKKKKIVKSALRKSEKNF